MQDIKTVIEKLHCYRLKMRSELCTDRSCPYNNNDTVYGLWCCSNRLLHDAETLLKTYQMKEQKQIVRCKECKHWNVGTCENDYISRQIDDCGCLPTFHTEPDWFCANGERKEHDAQTNRR